MTQLAAVGLTVIHNSPLRECSRTCSCVSSTPRSVQHDRYHSFPALTAPRGAPPGTPSLFSGLLRKELTDWRRARRTFVVLLVSTLFLFLTALYLWLQANIPPNKRRQLTSYRPTHYRRRRRLEADLRPRRRTRRDVPDRQLASQLHSLLTASKPVSRSAISLAKFASPPPSSRSPLFSSLLLPLSPSSSLSTVRCRPCRSSCWLSAWVSPSPSMSPLPSPLLLSCLTRPPPLPSLSSPSSCPAPLSLRPIAVSAYLYPPLFYPLFSLLSFLLFLFLFFFLFLFLSLFSLSFLSPLFFFFFSPFLFSSFPFPSLSSLLFLPAVRGTVDTGPPSGAHEPRIPFSTRHRDPWAGARRLLRRWSTSAPSEPPPSEAPPSGDPGIGVPEPGGVELVEPQPGQQNVHPVPLERLDATASGTTVSVDAYWTSGVDPCYVLDQIQVDTNDSDMTVDVTVTRARRIRTRSA